MASHTSKAFLSLGRINVSALGVQKSVSRVTYVTDVSVNTSAGNKGILDRGGRGFNKRPRRVAGNPRTEKMPVDQDWTSVYPAPTPFRPNAIPLPVRMGYPVKRGVPPEKRGNLELIKIPNFLHLTPAAIKKHCEALKPFCTEWPSVLDTDVKCDEQFPIKIKITDYVSAGPSLRNPSARVVHLEVKLSSLNLDEHARKKMIKLVNERYCKDTDTLTIITDRCPLRQQNFDYAMYLLTVLYHESWYLPNHVLDLLQTGCYANQIRIAVMMVINLKHLESSRAEALSLPRFKLPHTGPYCSPGNVMTARQAADGALHMEKYYLCERSIKEGKTEAWEAEKTVADMEEYSWEDSPSQKNLLDLLVSMKVAGEGEGEEVREQLLGKKEVQEYKDSVTRLMNEGENESTVLQYKEAVKKVLNL